MIFMVLFCVVYIDMKVVISRISLITIIGSVFRRLAEFFSGNYPTSVCVGISGGAAAYYA